MALIRKHIFLDEEQVEELHSYLMGRNFSLAMRIALDLLLSRLRGGEDLFRIEADSVDWEDVPHPAAPMEHRGS